MRGADRLAVRSLGSAEWDRSVTAAMPDPSSPPHFLSISLYLSICVSLSLSLSLSLFFSLSHLQSSSSYLSLSHVPLFISLLHTNALPLSISFSRSLSLSLSSSSAISFSYLSLPYSLSQLPLTLFLCSPSCCLSPPRSFPRYLPLFASPRSSFSISLSTSLSTSIFPSVCFPLCTSLSSLSLYPSLTSLSVLCVSGRGMTSGQAQGQLPVLLTWRQMEEHVPTGDMRCLRIFFPRREMKKESLNVLHSVTRDLRGSLLS